MKKILPLLVGAALMITLSLVLPVSAAADGFSDVKAGSWYYDEINLMAEQGYLNGFPDGSFRPNAAITGAEYVSIVARLAGLTAATGQCSHWAAGTVQAALDAGWFDWDELPPTGESFDSPLPRQVAVKMMMLALAPEMSGEWAISAGIKDWSAVNGRYYNTTLAAYAAGLIVGDDKGNFNPQGSLRRSEAAVMVWRALHQLGLDPAAPVVKPEPGEVVPISGGVSENGWLQVIGTQLCNADGEPVVLRGMSSHGMQWYGRYASSGALQTLTEYGANLFRIAMYTDENGYIAQPEQVKKSVTAAVEAAIANDMYVIIDWHILHDGDPNTYKKQALSFFAEMAELYKEEPSVLYEICNEPNGNVSWEGQIRPYAVEVLSVICAHSPDSVVIVGTPTWSQEVDKVAANPLKDDNVMYALHFYAGTHTAWLRERVDAALKAGTPIFVSEWGASSADGSGGTFLTEAQLWVDFMAERNLSWANWSLCDKDESSAALKPGASAAGGWKESELSESGKFVFKNFR